MESTQSYNTNKGIKDFLKDYSVFVKNFRKSQTHKSLRETVIRAYRRMYNDTLLFPPCNIVSSLRNDITNYHYQNLKNDIKVVKHSDKLLY